MKSRWMFPLALLGVFALSATACGGGHGHRDMTPERAKKMAAWKLDDVLDDVDATKKQRSAVLASKDRMIDRMFEMRKDQEAEREELAKLLTSDAPDKARVHALVDQAAERWKTMAHEAADEALGLNPQFDAAQRQALAEMWEEHRR